MQALAHRNFKAPVKAGEVRGKTGIPIAKQAQDVVQPRTIQLVTAVKEFKFNLEHLYVSNFVEFVNAYS